MFSAGLPGSSSGKEPTCQCRRCKRHSFNPRVRKTPWRKAWQPTPVFLSGEAHGQRSLVGCSPWALAELDATEATLHACMHAHVFSSSCVLFDHLNVSIMRKGLCPSRSMLNSQSLKSVPGTESSLSKCLLTKATITPVVLRWDCTDSVAGSKLSRDAWVLLQVKGVLHQETSACS